MLAGGESRKDGTGAPQAQRVRTMRLKPYQP
jgi:hypothetical protein